MTQDNIRIEMLKQIPIDGEVLVRINSVCGNDTYVKFKKKGDLSCGYMTVELNGYLFSISAGCATCHAYEFYKQTNIIATLADSATLDTDYFLELLSKNIKRGI